MYYIIRDHRGKFQLNPLSSSEHGAMRKLEREFNTTWIRFEREGWKVVKVNLLMVEA